MPLYSLYIIYGRPSTPIGASVYYASGTPQRECGGVLVRWYTDEGERGIKGVSGSACAWMREEKERRTRDK